MKRAPSIATICICLLMIVSSCKKEFVEGFEMDNNRPTDVSVDVLLAGAEVYTIYITSGDLTRRN